MGSDEGGLLASEDGLLCGLELRTDGGVVVEIKPQVFVDALVHPVLRLFVAPVVEIAVGLHEVDILVNHIPYFLHTRTVESAIAEHPRTPATVGHGEEMEGIAEVRGCHLTTVYIVAVALVDDDAVADLHDAALDALEFITGACHLDEQEEIHHRVTGRLALSYTYRLDEDLVEACGLTEDDGLAGLTGYTTQRTCRWTGADEGVRMQGEFLHAGLVTEDTALGTFRRGVDGKDSKFATFLLEYVDTELVDTRRLARSRYTTDTHTDGVAAIGQALVDDLLSLGLMVGVDTLNEGYGLREYRDIALEDTLHHLCRREFTAFVAPQIGVDNRWLLDTAIDLQACIF